MYYRLSFHFIYLTSFDTDEGEGAVVSHLAAIGERDLHSISKQLK